jgi:hypothetical protein
MPPLDSTFIIVWRDVMDEGNSFLHRNRRSFVFTTTNISLVRHYSCFFLTRSAILALNAHSTIRLQLDYSLISAIVAGMRKVGGGEPLQILLGATFALDTASSLVQVMTCHVDARKFYSLVIAQSIKSTRNHSP